MTALTERLRQGAGQAWDTLTQGWHELRRHASGALTRFRHTGATTGRPAQLPAGFDPVGWGVMAADIRVDDDRVVVRVEAPGMAREDLHIDVDPDHLRVWGEKRIDTESVDGDYRLVQCAYGSFERSVALPHPVDATRAHASYRDGVLRIEMPRLQRGDGRRIEVH